MEPWTRQLLSIIVSQICKTMGWHSISTTSLQILVDVLHRYLKQLGTNIHGYTEHFNHTFPALEEINLAFIEMGINVEDLREYVDYVSSIPLKTKVPKYPLEKKSNLNFLKPGSREVVTRPVHIHEHLPAMYPELSEEGYPSTETAPSDDLPNLSSAGSPSSFKKLEPDVINNKRITQLISEEVGRPLRELSCVMMTTSGFLSPAREGKAPEPRIPKLNNYSNLHPTQPSSYPTVPPEVKGDHKKSRDSSKIVNNVKSVEKKIRDEVHQNGKEDLDDGKIKKLASMKELSKLKAFKPLHKTDSVDSPKMIRPEKLKLPASPSPKESKVVKPKVEKPVEKIPEPEIIVEEKLTTEPNKQKLNIFKRISKVKEERAESPVPKMTAEKNAQINETIEAVVKRSREKDEVEKISHREEKPKVENSPEIAEPAPMKHLKRKKKQKHDIPAKKFKEINHEPEEMEKPKPKMIEIESEVPLYSMMKTPGIIPAALTQNPLFPRFPHPFINLNRFDNNGPHPEMPNLPLPPASLMQANVDNVTKPPPIRTPDIEPQLDDGAAIADKKLKKKMKKDKREKDKKKTKKDKLKNKEKLDKKKDKVLKKIKVKNKNKIKKEKKFTLEKDNIPTEDPSVPKLKLKLGNANSPQLSPSGVQSPKIVIKPIVKHDEPPKSPEPFREREPSPELAKISALISKPIKQKQHKIDTPSTSFSKPIEPITIKNKKSLSNEVKPKNKEKQKVKKNEEHKTKPAPYYFDASGNQVWICPACGARDDGSPMIGCDGCDAWYHWVCVGIKSPPESPKWFCSTCANA